MKLQYLFSYNVKISKPINIGSSRHGIRDLFKIEGGEVWGDGIKATVLPIGGEFQLTDSDGKYHIDVRTAFETDDGARVYAQYQGVADIDEAATKKLQEQGYIDYGDAYFATTPRFETGHEKYRWLNDAICVAEGRISKAWTVEYRVYQCLPTK